MNNINKKFNFGGISGKLDESLKDQWELIYDDNNVIWETKDVFTHDDEEFSFKYKYMIEAVDFSDFDPDVEEDASKYYVEIHMVVDPESLSKKVLANVKNTMDEHIEYWDILRYGLSIQMAHNNELVLESELDSKIIEAMNCIPVIDGLRGFYLDKPWNRIGTTGWDTIQYAIGLTDSLF